MVVAQNGFPTNKQSQVKELLAPAVTVAVVPDKEHLALIAGSGGADAGSTETKERYRVNFVTVEKVQVVPRDIAHFPA